MNEGLQWGLVGLGLLVVFVRRRYVAIGVVTLQAGLLGVGALAIAVGRPPEFTVAAVLLLARALLLGYFLFLSVGRTREPRPLRAEVTPFLRLGVVVVASILVGALVPPLGLESRVAEQASIALVLIGAATVVARRPTIFHLLGLMIAENGLGLAAVSVPGGLPLLIELGVAFDLVVIITVAIAFHEHIFGEFGTGDSTLLKGLHDR
ncbi:MAG: hypothetical protein ACYC33_07245 [Thermoleophilia bacterium]